MRRRRHSRPQECVLYENHTAGWLVSIDTRATRDYTVLNSTIDFSLHIVVVLVKAMYTTVLLTLFFIRRPCRINGHIGKIAYNVYSSSFLFMCQDPCHVIFRDFAQGNITRIGKLVIIMKILYFQTAPYGVYQKLFQPRDCYGIASPRKV